MTRPLGVVETGYKGRWLIQNLCNTLMAHYKRVAEQYCKSPDWRSFLAARAARTLSYLGFMIMVVKHYSSKLTTPQYQPV